MSKWFNHPRWNAIVDHIYHTRIKCMNFIHITVWGKNKTVYIFIKHKVSPIHKTLICYE